MLALTVRLIVSLSIVVGLLLLIARFGARRFRGKSDALVQIVHRQALSRTTGVAVVAVGSRVLVLGTTENQVTVLTELDPHEIDASELDPAALELELSEEPEEIEVLPPRPQARAASRPVAPPAPAFRSARPAARVPVTPPPVPSAAEVILAAAAQFEETGEVRPAEREQQADPAEPIAVPAAQPGFSAALAILQEEAATPIQLNRRTTAALTGSGPLAGSVLSAQTWKQAFAVVRGSSKKAS